MPIDYDKLASEHGGTAADTTDFDALAAEHGGTASEPFDVKKQNAINLANSAKQKNAGAGPGFLEGATGDSNLFTRAAGQLKRGIGGILSNPGTGGEPMQPGEKAASPDVLSGQLHDVVAGGGTLAAPVLLPAAVAAAPVATAGGIILGGAGTYGGRKAGQAMGLTENESNLMGDVVGLGAGAAGAKGGQAVEDTVTPVVKALADMPVVRRTALGVISPRARNAADLVGAVKEAINPTPAAGPKVKAPLSLDEQLGVSPESLGSTVEPTHAPQRAIIIGGRPKGGPEPTFAQPGGRGAVTQSSEAARSLGLPTATEQNFNDLPEAVKQEQMFAAQPAPMGVKPSDKAPANFNGKDFGGNDYEPNPEAGKALFGQIPQTVTPRSFPRIPGPDPRIAQAASGLETGAVDPAVIADTIAKSEDPGYTARVNAAVRDYAKPAMPGKARTPTHPQEGAFGRGSAQESVTEDDIAKNFAKTLNDRLSNIPNGKNAVPAAAPAEVTNAGGETVTTVNGSGESKASAEALARFKAAKGEGQVVVEEKGKPDQLITDPDKYVETRDNLKPGQELTRVNEDGTRESIDTSGAQRGPVGYKAKEFTQFAQEAADRIKGGEDETTALRHMEAAMRQEYMKRPASAGVKAREARMSAANFDAVLEKTKLDARVLAASKRK